MHRHDREVTHRSSATTEDPGSPGPSELARHWPHGSRKLLIAVIFTFENASGNSPGSPGEGHPRPVRRRGGELAAGARTARVGTFPGDFRRAGPRHRLIDGHRPMAAVTDTVAQWGAEEKPNSTGGDSRANVRRLEAAGHRGDELGASHAVELGGGRSRPWRRRGPADQGRWRAATTKVVRNPGIAGLVQRCRRAHWTTPGPQAEILGGRAGTAGPAAAAGAGVPGDGPVVAARHRPRGQSAGPRRAHRRNRRQRPPRVPTACDAPGSSPSVSGRFETTLLRGWPSCRRRSSSASPRLPHCRNWCRSPPPSTCDRRSGDVAGRAPARSLAGEDASFRKVPSSARHPARLAAEAGHLADGVQAGMAAPPTPSTRASRSVSRPPNVFG